MNTNLKQYLHRPSTIAAGAFVLGAVVAFTMVAVGINDTPTTNSAGGGNIGISTIADAPGGSIEFASTAPTGDLIAVSTSVGAGGSLAAPEAPVKDDLSPIAANGHATTAVVFIAPEQVA